MSGSGPTLREQKREFTRQRLINAAMTVFERDGYVGSRIEDITTEAGASRATFYLHFKSKLDVIRELIGPLHTDSVALYRRLDTVADSSWDDLYAWVSQAIDYWRRNRVATTALAQAVAVEPELAGHLVDTARDNANAMTGYLTRYPESERAAARQRIGMFILQLERVCFFWVIRGVPFDREVTLTALTNSLDVTLNPDRLHRRA